MLRPNRESSWNIFRKPGTDPSILDSKQILSCWYTSIILLHEILAKGEQKAAYRCYLTSPSSLPLADPSSFHSCCPFCLFFSFSYTSFHFAARKFGYNAADRRYFSLSSNLAIFSGRACRSKECSYPKSMHNFWKKMRECTSLARLARYSSFILFNSFRRSSSLARRFNPVRGAPPSKL
jgi:hypothetical protein